MHAGLGGTTGTMYARKAKLSAHSKVYLMCGDHQDKAKGCPCCKACFQSGAGSGVVRLISQCRNEHRSQSSKWLQHHGV